MYNYILLEHNKKGEHMNEAIKKIDEFILKLESDSEDTKRTYVETVLQPLESMNKELMSIYSKQPSKRLKRIIEHNEDMLLQYYKNYESFLDI